VAAHRCDGGELCTCCRQSSDQTQKDLRLSLRVSIRAVLGKLVQISVHDCQVQRGIGFGVPFDQTAIVIVSRGRSDTADQPEMHIKPPNRTVGVTRSSSSK
jgi:hypothetical protein